MNDRAKLRNITIAFNRSRVTKRQKAALITEATDLRRSLVRQGFSPQQIKEIEMGQEERCVSVSHVWYD